ncbi:CRISPR-associated endonuclease Cas2 [Candidatus Parcubacteria bacterium]|nr:CRISPR-associated endonuclease Cas2 [Candidatus Parcubacteria bacterium]
MSEYDRLGKKYRSPLHYILAGLIPYTEANVKLTFKPNQFFNDLEKLDRIKINKKAIRSTYYRAVKNGLIEFSANGKNPRLTNKGQSKLMPFSPEKLENSSLMVIFDIPEKDRSKRRQLRILLRELAFSQVQKSVWISTFDSREYLKSEIKQNKLENFVQVFEAHRI